ncbi:MAG: AAA family ATPase [Sulfolobales archaeon]|nr:AAA family ATPase [Sulfolobales archaeon]
MIIRHIRLSNILSHENSEVSFPDGIIAIVGPNGAGKSSIIDSIYASLFTDATIDIRGRKKEFFVMRGRERGGIEVSLEVGGIKYLITKEIGVGTPIQAYLYVVEGSNKKIKGVGVSNVANEVGKILDLPAASVKDLRNMVRSTIISLQDELTKIIDITDSERREWILSLLGLSYLEKSLEIIKKFTSKKDKLEGMLESEKNELNNKLREFKEIKSRKASLELKLSQYNSTIKDLRKKHDDIYEKVALINEALQILERLKALIIIKRVKELEELKSRLEVLESFEVNEYLRVKDEYDRRVRDLTSHKSKLADVLHDISNKLGVYVNDYDSLNKLLTELRLKGEELSGLINRSRALKELYALFIDKFELTKECPICGSSIKDPILIKSSLTQELVKLSERIKELSRESTNIKMKIEIVENTLDRLVKLINTIEVLEKSISEISDRLNDLNRNALRICGELSESFKAINNESIERCIEYLRSRRDILNKVRGELEYLNNLRVGLTEDLQPLEIHSLRGRVSEIFVKLSVNYVVPERWEDVDVIRNRLSEMSRKSSSELDRVKEEIFKTEKTITEIEAVLKELSSRAEALDGYIKEVEKKVSELESQIKSYEIILEFFSKYLGKDGLIAKELTRVVRDELERRTNRILSKIGLRPIEINDEFQIRVKVLGDSLPISNASGGEKVGISIALRLALAELIMGREPTTLILDEPTVYLDDDRREQIFEIIKELSKSLKQIIVVTHDESVIDIADKVIKVERVGEVSKVSS